MTHSDPFRILAATEGAVWFDGWEGLARMAIAGVVSYIALVLLLRVAGNRTLSKMNAFDLVVTVALGSTLATVLLSRDVAIAEGTLAFALLIGLQFCVTWSSVRFQWVRQYVTGEPQMLLYRGRFLSKDLKRCRVTEAEILAAIREAGLNDLKDAQAVVLETDGSFSVVQSGAEQGESSLVNVRRLTKAS